MLTLVDVTDTAATIRAAREALPGKRGRPLSREALAHRVGVVSTTIQKWESSGLPYAAEYVRLADALGISLDELLRGDAGSAAEQAARVAEAGP